MREGVVDYVPNPTVMARYPADLFAKIDEVRRAILAGGREPSPPAPREATGG